MITNDIDHKIQSVLSEEQPLALLALALAPAALVSIIKTRQYSNPRKANDPVPQTTMPNKKASNKTKKKESKSSSLKVLRKLFEKANKLGYDLPPPPSAAAAAGGPGGGACGGGGGGVGTELDVSSWLVVAANQKKGAGSSSAATTTTTTTSTTTATTPSTTKEAAATMVMKDGVDELKQQDINDDIENVENGMSKAKISSSGASQQQHSQSVPGKLTLHSWSSSELKSRSMLEPCLDLFEQNMSSLYEKSSWGLDIQSKKEELQHHRARFLVLLLTKEEAKDLVVVGFCHYRYEYDDDDDPTAVVLYVYEIQILQEYRRLGLGRHLMRVVEELVVKSSSGDGGGTTTTIVQKVMLTVFKNNQSAMGFYLSKLQYQIDETSPSRHGLLSEDYEILSKNITI